ncbi:inositol monophosphatase family protein [Gracilibacillus alcaliphilus]|uniref:inositol monophosphatase family protein n=1 Tax=Gracilibacillus alcaliphilus TaxID=1401441 RepID=UPI001958D2ED|nr:inositol monophosphatase family protein [Gracilibacillus alcaliphilus]MBM7678664.1 myo-inositol-1(or 4)-monophosphatase [Gracilibacillus alcaliphilus]
METTIRQNIFENAKKWVYEAGKRIREQMQHEFQINTKSNVNDLVTEIDRSTEQFFANQIRTTYPSHYIISEEGFGDKINDMNGTIWIIDPIDGTMNFVHQKRNFAISIGIYHNGVGEIALIYNVIDDVLYTAIKGEGAYRNRDRLPQLKQDVQLETSILAMNSLFACENRRVNEKKIQQLIIDCRGTRSYGSAALEFAYVAEGIIDAYVTLRLSPWDFGAGLILVREVGGETIQLDGKPVNFLQNNTILTCNPAIRQRILTDYIEWK